MESQNVVSQMIVVCAWCQSLPRLFDRGYFRVKGEGWKFRRKDSYDLEVLKNVSHGLCPMCKAKSVASFLREAEKGLMTGMLTHSEYLKQISQIQQFAK